MPTLSESAALQKRVLSMCRKVLRERYTGRKRVTAAFFNHVREEMDGHLPEGSEALLRDYVVTATGLQCSRCFLGQDKESVESLPAAALLDLAKNADENASRRLRAMRVLEREYEHQYWTHLETTGGCALRRWSSSSAFWAACNALLTSSSISRASFSAVALSSSRYSF